MFETLIVQPIYNLLLFIYAYIPGHDFGIAIILFTLIVRFALWPLVRKQLHHSRAMRELQPDIKKIKKRTKGDRQKQSQLLMELYKEREINPFSSLGVLLLQLPILIALALVEDNVIDAEELKNADKDTVKSLNDEILVSVDEKGNTTRLIEGPFFEQKLFGKVDLSRRAIGDEGVYLPLLAIAVAAAVFQYYQSKQLTPDVGEKKKLKDILKASAEGKDTDQTDINEAMGRNMRIIFPFITGFFAATFPGSLALYWTSGSVIGFFQNRHILNQDVEEMSNVKVKVSDNDNKTKKSKKKKDKSSKKKKR